LRIRAEEKRIDLLFADMPGVPLENVEIGLASDQLTIRGRSLQGNGGNETILLSEYGAAQDRGRKTPEDCDQVFVIVPFLSSVIGMMAEKADERRLLATPIVNERFLR
jgi:hypothetical protein